MSGCVTDHLEFGLAIHACQQLINPLHSGMLQLCIATLCALQNRERFQNDNGELCDLKGQIGDAGFKVSTTDAAIHGRSRLTLRLTSH